MKSILLVTAIIFLFSCDADNESTLSQDEETIEEVGFFNLSVGNSWSYEYFEREQPNDPSSDFVSTGTTEVREVISSERIDDEIVYTIEVTSVFGDNDFLSEFDEELETYQVKDSLGYLVQIDAGILFSSINNEEYFLRTLGQGEVFGVLLDTPEAVITPAGNFEATVNEVFAVFSDGELSQGRDHRLMEAELGEVLTRTSLVSNPLHIVERRLTAFNFPE